MLHILFEPLYHGTIVPFKRIEREHGVDALYTTIKPEV